MAPKVVAPTVEEIVNDGLDNVNECCARLQIPDVLRDAVGVRIGSPGVGTNYSLQLLVQLTQQERDNTVDNVPLQDAAQPAQPRPPTLFEKARVRSLFALVDMVSNVLKAPRAPPAPPAAPAAQPQLQQALQPLAGGRKVNVSEVLDPMDERLVDPSSPGELNQFYANDRDLKHGYPQQECEPTLGQTSSHPVAHPRKRGTMFITTREGTEVRFTFAKGARDQCSDPCPAGRAHACQHCLGPHRNAECNRANNQGGKGGKGGKGKWEVQHDADKLDQALTQSEPEAEDASVLQAAAEPP